MHHKQIMRSLRRQCILFKSTTERNDLNHSNKYRFISSLFLFYISTSILVIPNVIKTVLHCPIDIIRIFELPSVSFCYLVSYSLHCFIVTLEIALNLHKNFTSNDNWTIISQSSILILAMHRR